MPSTAAASPPASPWAGPVLALLGFAVWAVFSILPGLLRTGGAFYIREAWDTGAFWMIGAPLIGVAQAAAGAADGGPLPRQPLWTLGGFFAGVLLVHPAGSDFGLLPLALIFVGGPAYAVLLALTWLGRALGRWR